MVSQEKLINSKRVLVVMIIGAKLLIKLIIQAFLLTLGLMTPIMMAHPQSCRRQTVASVSRYVALYRFSKVRLSRWWLNRSLIYGWLRVILSRSYVEIGRLDCLCMCKYRQPHRIIWDEDVSVLRMFFKIYGPM